MVTKLTACAGRSPPLKFTAARGARRPSERNQEMIRAAIIGVGRWGQNLVGSVQGKSDVIRFTAGATRTVSKAEAYANEKGFPLYDSYERALADPDIDAVVLATPHTQHAEQVAAAARARKHVFVEKP